ncbi:NUMOD4 domain-containing protein [Lentzea atacamensis]|uniref:NUMOD4 domain-containing protein n=1 Tax=Lentzea atacamensis TaxID=531938 RepID=UPI000DD39CFF
MAKELWGDIPEYEGLYQVSDHGRVRSLDREIECMSRWGDPMTKRWKGRVMKPTRSKLTGHLMVSLWRSGEMRKRTIHTLVAEVFIGPRPVGMEVLHGPNGVTDNSVSNLSYGTHAQNMRDMLRDGTHNEARKTHCKYGHPFNERNLAKYMLKRGRRLCLACSRAQSALKDIRKAGKAEPNFQRLSDIKYAAIRNGGQDVTEDE